MPVTPPASWFPTSRSPWASGLGNALPGSSPAHGPNLPKSSRVSDLPGPFPGAPPRGPGRPPRPIPVPKELTARLEAPQAGGPRSQAPAQSSDRTAHISAVAATRPAHRLAGPPRCGSKAASRGREGGRGGARRRGRGDGEEAGPRGQPRALGSCAGGGASPTVPGLCPLLFHPFLTVHLPPWPHHYSFSFSARKAKMNRLARLVGSLISRDRQAPGAKVVPVPTPRVFISPLSNHIPPVVPCALQRTSTRGSGQL